MIARIASACRMIMTTDAQLLRLLAWLSPAFPTGGFAYSHGLEWAIEAGDIRDAAGLRAWLEDVLAHGSGRNDAILLRAAHPAWDDSAALREVADYAAASCAGRERLAEALAQGAAFLRAAVPWRDAAWAFPEEIPYAVAVGALAGAHGIAADAACAGYLHAFTTNLISAAVRAVPLGQTAGLAVQAALAPQIIGIAAATRGAGLDDLGGACFRSDIAAMRHETQYTRLFRT